MKKNVLAAFRFLTAKAGLVSVFALFTALFQLFVLTRARVFYPVLRILFAFLVLQLLAAFVQAASRRKLLWLAVPLVILVRIPFYIHADGAMLTSDNAHEALQGVEMRDTHVAPYFLLGAVKHMGTIKYMTVAFLMDLIGNRYLAFLLIQILLFIVLLFALEELLRESLHPPALFVFLFLTQFAFIETVFDFSLSLRGAPYLDMLFYAVLGAGLIDRNFKARGRTILGYYFLFFSIYIHPLSAVLVGSFGLVFLIFSFLRKRFWTNALAAAAGLAAGLYHWFYYLLFLPKPVAGGGWEQMGLVPFSKISWGYLKEYIGILHETFQNVFNFEFSYLSPYFNAGRGALTGYIINQILVWFSLAVTAAGIVLAVRKIVRLVLRRDDLRDADWPWFLACVLAVAFAAKAFLFYPPHTEPRHNFDLVFLIILCYLLVFSTAAGALGFARGSASAAKARPLTLARLPRVRSRATAALLALSVIVALPHVVTYDRLVRDKEKAYHSILSILEKSRVRYLTTDFIVAYPIYFLSGRTIRVTDSLGPLTLRAFYPDMRAEIDAAPPDDKAYMFFSERAPNRPWHKEVTRIIFRRTINELTTVGITFRTHKLRDYVIIIPRRRD
jgi:hypothetical protein